jgi:Fe-S-cluster-containing hydrogenase component 2
MPIVCKQCKVPACRDGCPVGAITVEDGVVAIDDEKCISCQSCVISCPDGAIFVHSDIHTLGQVHRMASALGYAHLQEVEYWEHGIKKTLRYADIGEHKLE